MPITDGFKQTEVGVIPEDWEVGAVKDLAAITTGAKNTQDRIDDGRFPFFVRSQTVERINSFSFNGEAVLTAGDGVGTGKVFHYINGPFDFHQRVYKISDFASELNGYYFFLYFKEHFYERIMQMTAKSSVDSVRMEMIANMFVPLPSVPEQRAIAEALSDVDALINALDALITKKRHIKQGTMQQLLTGKKRLPGFTGEWAKKEIGEEIELLTGFPFPSHRYAMTGVRLLRGSNIKRGVTDWNGEITKYWAEITSDHKQYELCDRDIVIAMDGSLVGRSFAQLSEADLPALLLQRVARVRSKAIDMGYLKEQICSVNFTEHCDSVKTVTAIPHISPKDIRGYIIPIPPTKQEQRAIAEILSDMDAEITALEQKRDKTKLIKQGMMQELLTGKTRLV